MNRHSNTAGDRGTMFWVAVLVAAALALLIGAAVAGADWALVHRPDCKVLALQTDEAKLSDDPKRPRAGVNTLDKRQWKWVDVDGLPAFIQARLRADFDGIIYVPWPQTTNVVIVSGSRTNVVRRPTENVVRCCTNSLTKVLYGTQAFCKTPVAPTAAVVEP